MAGNIQLSDYDPALAEVAREGDSNDEVSVIARLADAGALPEGVTLVTRFGDIATLRLQRKKMTELMHSESVVDLEASRCFWQADDMDDPAFTNGSDSGRPSVFAENASYDLSDVDAYTRRPPGLTATGQGCVVGVLDWGLDIAFPGFRHADGDTRLLALWDQRDHDTEVQDKNNRWGYGRIFTTEDINRALNQEDPYQALDYDPADADARDKRDQQWMGSHATHVTHIAAGNSNGGGMSGVAPDADLVFVHLSHTARVLGQENLGDSASILEAIDFVFSIAGDRPCVINMSVGAHGGPHDGMTLLEQGIDRAVWLNDSRVVVNSAGNYFNARAHAQGRLRNGEEDVLEFEVPADDPTSSELEVYYESSDRFTASILGPDDSLLATADVGEESPLMLHDKEVGYMYHRTRQTGSGDRHIDIFLNAHAMPGIWKLVLKAEFVDDGRFHAWIERDRGLRPKFISDDVSTFSTTGTICNGRFSITVGAYDPHKFSRPMGRFSSSGPTRDGRIKPEIIAPGVAIVAARSTPPGELPGARYTSKNGTSMAAPHVAGAVALMFEAAGLPMNISDVRALLFASADAISLQDGMSTKRDLHRTGYGYLNLVAAEKAAADWGMAKSQVEDVVEDGQEEIENDLMETAVVMQKPSLAVPLHSRSATAKYLQADDIDAAEAAYDDITFSAQDSTVLDESLLQVLTGLLPADGTQQLANLALSLLDRSTKESSQDVGSADSIARVLNVVDAEAIYEEET